ncbi:N-acetylmuramidase domain-containing protein [Oharaeibacter diazotrophicus]|uniref:Putative peptidoglycan binding protein n=1 Tax=Oharaeibacter diazotrophicus TaxID=1920512 RepID=A0A4R6RGN0_9HYPH|nr:N-acetylmuramidase domain-containing protein [Oharaeibacter diazotrophicus]TDP85404.1 putative peptidoglycan binding protein [Oharaeibacter diazotrophicus]BBE74374.1 putative peptidoglycan binding domain protein [Pleomorphomonas sp. SM30]GLS75933.1 hypothetical protein GCM10007904_12680 [Oharaeibacter diazotrophicus]
MTIDEMIAAGFRGRAEPLGRDDVAVMARAAGLDPAVLAAVLQVEAAGTGFDRSGRPTMLREPHVFFRCLDVAKRRQAQDAGLAWPVWRPGHYPASADQRYADLVAACAIDPVAALMSCSWGIGQTLGENWRLCGHASVVEMVECAMRSEAEQVGTMLAFIRARRLDVPLQAHDWARFARGYNGPAYRRHDYDGRLARAHAAALEQRPPQPEAALGDGVLRLGDKGELVRAMQMRLGDRGYAAGAADGWFGRITEQAVRAFQGEQRLVVDGKVGHKTAAALGLNFWPAG